jgi:hypothetical protein
MENWPRKMRIEPLVTKIKIHWLQKFDIRKFTNSQQSCNEKKFIRKTCPGHKFFRLSMNDTRKLVENCRVFMGILDSTILRKNREAKLNFQRKVLKRIQAFSVSKFKQNQLRLIRRSLNSLLFFCVSWLKSLKEEWLDWILSLIPTNCSTKKFIF